MRVQSWKKILLMACVISLLVDPIFFYIPQIHANRKCLVLDRPLKIITCALRTFLDLFYFILHVMLQFRAGFIAPSSRVFGGGELILDPEAVAKRYLSSKFIIDLLSIIPLPQVFVLVPLIMQKEYLKYIVLAQYVPRIVRMYPFFREVTRTEKAWAAAAYNLLLYMLASHVVGSMWYLLSVESEIRCWSQELKNANLSAATKYLSCRHQNSTVLSLLKSSCPLKNPDEIDDPAAVFNFGIFIDALRSRVVESTTNFRQKIFYCFCSLGQDLKTSTFIEEILFTVFIAIFGLILFALLIGNVQRYLQSMQSTAVRAEEMRLKIQSIEKWLSRRMLPLSLRKRIMQYEHYKWEQHEGVDEEILISNLPKDLRRDIKRHLCLGFLSRVPMFERMHGRLIDALCDRMKPVLYTEESYIVQEGDEVDEMLFSMRGKLNSVTTNGGRTGFFNSSLIKEGDFCGDELLTWAFDPNSCSSPPVSTRTVQSITEVEAYALMAYDLKLVIQNECVINEHMEHTLRFYSQQWRTWAACFIQAAWRRHVRRKMKKSEAFADDEQCAVKKPR